MTARATEIRSRRRPDGGLLVNQSWQDSYGAFSGEKRAQSAAGS